MHYGRNGSKEPSSKDAFRRSRFHPMLALSPRPGSRKFSTMMASTEGRSGPLLLDTVSLLALAWPNHQYHREVVARLERQPAMPWATCALTLKWVS